MPNLGSLKKIINYKIAYTLTAVCFVCLAALNLVTTNTLATEGTVVSEAEAEIIKLEKENQSLSLKIEELCQLKTIEEEATSRGYVRSKSIVFAPTPPTFAQR